MKRRRARAQRHGVGGSDTLGNLTLEGVDMRTQGSDPAGAEGIEDERLLDLSYVGARQRYPRQRRARSRGVESCMRSAKVRSDWMIWSLSRHRGSDCASSWVMGGTVT